MSSSVPAGAWRNGRVRRLPGFARAVLVALACTLLSPAVGEAAPATLKGRLTGVKLPAAGAGVSSVRAMDLNSSAVVAAAYTTGRGAFRLRVPGGSYGLLAAVVPFRGPKVIEKVVGRVRLRAGKKRSVKLALKKAKPTTKRSRGRRRPSRAGTAAVADGFGDVAVDYPAIAVRPFESINPTDQFLGKGIADMLITDLGAAIGARAPCKAILVERTRLDAVLRELRRSRGPAFDPGTRPKSGRVIKDNAKVTGTLARANGAITVTASYTDLKTGKATTFTESGPESDFFAMERRLTAQLAEHICGNALPNSYEGTFGGSWESQATGERWTFTGNVELVYTSDAPGPPPGAPPGRYRTFTVASGNADVSVTAESPFGCGFVGSGPVQLDPGASGQLWVEADATPAYQLGLQSVGKNITVTKTGSDPGCNAGSTTQYPVPGMWAQSRSARTSGSAALADQETVATPETPFDYDYTTRWNLAPR